jgi:hypothetical protein
MVLPMMLMEPLKLVPINDPTLMLSGFGTTSAGICPQHGAGPNHVPERFASQGNQTSTDNQTTTTPIFHDAGVRMRGSLL